MVHRELSWMQQIEMDYDASCFDIDPYQAMPGGVGGVWPFLCGKFVELPYTLPQDHTLLTLDRLSHEVWIEKYELVRKLRGMALLITHPDYLITEKSLDEYRQFLAFVAADTKAFRCLPHEVARWWRQRDSETPSPSLVSIPLSELFSEL